MKYLIPISTNKFSVYPTNSTIKWAKKLSLFLIVLIITLVVILLLPWTQTVEAKGKLTTLRPEQRPQDVVSIISGRIQKWYIREGQFVKKGDTLVYLTEVKEDYLDPLLIERTGKQVEAKASAVQAYKGKINALDKQIEAIEENLFIKLQQAQNKIQQVQTKKNTEIAELEAAQANYTIQKQQYERGIEMTNKGLRSTTDLENRENKYKEAEAKLQVAKNKIDITTQEIQNATMEQNAIQADYGDKLAKSEGEKFSALSLVLDAEGGIQKLQVQYQNYQNRAAYYYILAPQDGYISQIKKYGVGEIIKDASPILTIVPSQYDKMVEMFVAPVDMPLMQIGAPVCIQFDGWPAIFISGWPGSTIGTYPGKVIAIDQTLLATEKGYRILVAPDSTSTPWPELLHIGSGVEAYTLLQDVPVGYEIWRKLNGFPPEFYTSTTNTEKSEKTK